MRHHSQNKEPHIEIERRKKIELDFKENEVLNKLKFIMDIGDKDRRVKTEIDDFKDEHLQSIIQWHKNEIKL